MKPELLAPVNKDTLEAAITFGADAVYFGVEQFNARLRANNFKLVELKEVISKCHKNGVKAYLTLNILIKNYEINSFFNILKEAYLAGIDAVIIQEVSFIDIIRKNFPNLEIHLSTQTAITNPEQLELLSKVDGIILPRELTLAEIESFSKIVPTEVFIQGALCFSYSGLCLLSSFSGMQRSGNRGTCSQLCRKRYNNKYLLNMKDLCTLDCVQDLIKAGVSSFKIEGRLRTPNYIAEAVKAYKQAIDSNSTPDITNLKLAYNRGFTKGFAFTNIDLINPISTDNLGLYLGTVDKNLNIKLKTNLQRGDGIRIIRDTGKNGALIKKIYLKNRLVSQAKKEDIIKLDLFLEPEDQLYKTSSINKAITDYVNTKNPIVIPQRKVKEIILPKIKENKFSDTLLLVKTYTLEEAEKALENKADRVFYSIFEKDYINKLGAYIPRILNSQELKDVIYLINEYKPDYILTGNTGILNHIKAKEIYIDYSINCFNDLDINFYNKFAIPIISPELSYQELINFKDKRFGVLIHGDFPVITTKNKLTQQNLVDEKGFKYKVRKEFNYYQLLSSRPLGLFDNILKLKESNINIFFLDLDKKVQSTIRIYKDILENKKLTTPRMKKGFTLGHFKQNVF